LSANLKCLCRQHHLLKTFWGWRDHQLPDATVIWTLPPGQTYVTTPGSALLFPTLAAPTAALPTPQPPRPDQGCGDRAVMMPKRQRTRAQNRAHYIATERAHNRNQRLARAAALTQAAARAAPPTDPDEPPPF
jgi:hypothetical protein